MDRAALEELLEISHAVGADEDITQAGGGNTSVKTAHGTMLIKASGTPLADMSIESGWVELDLAGVQDLMEDQRLREMPAADREAALVKRLAALTLGGPGARPSVECVVHALMDRVVIHTHAIAPGSYACAEDGEAQIRKLDIADEASLTWLPYGDPGYPLALEIKRRKVCTPFLIQANHGLFVQGASAAQALARHGDMLQACGHGSAVKIDDVPSPSDEQIRDTVLAIRYAHGRIHHPEAERIECHTAPLVRLAQRRELAAAAVAPQLAEDLCAGALSPDGIVYTGPAPLRLPIGADVEARIKQHVDEHGVFPKLLIADGVGTFMTGDSLSSLEATEATAAANSRMLLAIRAAGRKPAYMDAARVEYIKGWEVERYRASLLKGAGDQPLDGRIALVTGAGSGLGRSIANGLAKAGAVVCFTDIDEAAAADAAQAAVDNGDGGALALKMDVTDEDSVAGTFAAVLRRLGGIDIVVNAAGVAPPFNLVDFPLKQWEFALRINLTGYFLVAREAARIMKQQRLGGAMVCLSSKSGLEASKANSAYNATKSGEIHMARGWAMELADDLIRVNCVAPGNVFEGSKIWNPDYIAKAAEKKGIKPEEVIPHYVNLTPLRMEIKGQDIADSVVFLSSDNARRMTGQVLVVDCGQVMVR